jgi:hypothetical protein
MRTKVLPSPRPLRDTYVSLTFWSLWPRAPAMPATQQGVRLLGAALAIRPRCGLPRFKVYDDDHHSLVAALRYALSDIEFHTAWDEGSGLSAEQAIAYAQRGRGERKRPSSGWGSLTPTELHVVRLVGEGFPNKDVAT